MKRTWVFAAAAALCVSVALFFCACSNVQKNTGLVSDNSEKEQHVLIEASPQAAPLLVTRGYIQNEEGIMFYPRLSGENSKIMNASIEKEVADCALEMGEQVFTTYKITSNGNGVFSTCIQVYDLETEKLLSTLPLNYSIKTGEKVALSAYFDGENDKWKRVLPDIVTLQAQARGLTLLSDVLPVTEGQLYYISGGDLVLVYRQYEITTYSDSMPEFSIPISQLTEFLSEGSPLTLLVDAQPVITEVVAPTPQETLATLNGADAAEPTPTPISTSEEAGNK